MYNFKNKMIMNAKLLKNIFVMLFAVMAFVACSSDDDNTDYDLTRSITNDITSKKDLPSWLVDIVENLEQIKADANSSEIGIVWQLEGNDSKTYYGIYAPFTGVMHVMFYHADGKACDITSEKQYNDFIEKVSGIWKRIYHIMDGEMVLFLGMEIPFVGLQDDMPEWLVEWMKESVFEFHSMVCQGTVNGETIYYVDNTLMSSLFGQVYNKDGKLIKTPNNDTSKYVRTGENWVCLYHVGNSGAFVIPGWSK